MSTYLSRCGDNWMTEDVEISFHLPGDTSWHDTLSSQMLQPPRDCNTCRTGANRARRSASVAKHKMLPSFIFIGKLLCYLWLIIQALLWVNQPVYLSHFLALACNISVSSPSFRLTIIWNLWEHPWIFYFLEWCLLCYDPYSIMTWKPEERAIARQRSVNTVTQQWLITQQQRNCLKWHFLCNPCWGYMAKMNKSSSLRE
jgi:hypothetical protein